jgi:hypothetical protein
MDLDLLLVSTPLKSDANHHGLCPSLSTLTLGSYLARQGASVRVFDPSVEVETAGVSSAAILDEIARRCFEERPRFLGLSALSPVEGKFCAALARRVKALDPTLPVVMGGLWASTYKEQVMRHLPEVDAVIEGAGELPVARLLSASRGRVPAWSQVPGLTWRGGSNPPAGHYTAQLSVPLDFSLLRHPERYDIMVYLSSRGCPFRCSFCSEPLVFPNYVDEPIEKVRADVAAFVAVGKPYYFWICDPIFGFSPRRVDEICELFEPTPFEFLIESRVDVLKPAVVAQVARAGCRLIYFGLESGAYNSLRVLEKVRDRDHFERYRANTRALVEACAMHGVLPMFGVMNPVPGDTPDDLTECLAFLEELVAISSAIRPDLALHLLPLRCRMDMGSPMQVHFQDFAGRGVTRAYGEEDLFDDMLLVRASPTVGLDEGNTFRDAVRALWTPTHKALETLALSFPRPYLEVEWN